MRKAGQFRRGIYLLPTLFTVGNLFCGYSSLMQASLGRLDLAAMLIVLAAVLDGLDGRIARLSGTTSVFGVQFDSLADVVSFGIAPAVLAYHWALGPGRIGWSLAFLFVACAAMRLARFNIQSPALDKRFFVGLPAPMAGSLLAAMVIAFPELPQEGWVSALSAGLVCGVALLMVSRLRYRSFREIDLRNRRSYIYVLPIAGMLVVVTLEPKFMLLASCCAYLASPALLPLLDRRQRRAAAESAQAARAPGRGGAR